MSANALQKHDALLRQHKFVLVRQDRHKVYRNPEGRVYVTSSTPSDWRVAFNMLTALKRCIAEPPKPMVVAISDYEREQAAAVIASEPKFQHAPGTGSGKQKRSRGTGIYYDDKKVLTVEEILHANELREQAIANAKRREERQQERRAKKLARRQAVEQQRVEEAAEFERLYRPFLNVTRRFVEENETYLQDLCRAQIAHRFWQQDLNFYEFPEKDSREEEAEEWLHDQIMDQLKEAREDVRKTGERVNFFDFLEYLITEMMSTEAAMWLSHSDRVERIMKFVERRLSESNSLDHLREALNAESDRLNDKEDADGRLVSWDASHMYGALKFDLVDWVEDIGLTTDDDHVLFKVDPDAETTDNDIVHEIAVCENNLIFFRAQDKVIVDFINGGTPEVVAYDDDEEGADEGASDANADAA
jgi:hypothetical protein